MIGRDRVRLPRPMASPLLTPADVPMHSASDMAGLQGALRRVYDLHTFTRGTHRILSAACVEGCPGPWPCATRRTAAEALRLPEGET